MKLGVSSYSYSKLVKAGRMAEIQIPASAKAAGFDVLEFSRLSPPAGQALEQHAAVLAAECARVALPVVNYTIGADFLRAAGGWEAEAERLKGELRVAQILGAPGMRHDATAGFPPGAAGARGFDDALPTLARGCRRVTEIAAGMGIRTMVENHGFFCQDSERVEKLINAVNHPNFGWLVDMGNFLCADEDPAVAVGRAAPYAVHCHAKDFHTKPGTVPMPGQGWFASRAGNWLRGAIVGHGDVPVAQCVRLLKKSGYDGVLSLEFEGVEDPLLGIEWGLAALRACVG